MSPRATVGRMESGRSTTIRPLRASRSTIAPPPPAPPREPVVAARPAQRAAKRSAPAAWWDWLALAAIVALFCAIAGYNWRLPGLYNDEAYDVVPAMQLVLGQPVELNRGVGLRLFGRDLPVMISDYQGVTSMYGVLPLFALFGPGVGPTRAFTIGLGALALVLTYALGRRLFGRPVGLLAAALLAVSPSFVFWSRVGVYVVIQVAPLALGALLCALRWRGGGGSSPRSAGWLALAGLLVGLGLSTKILFIWFLFGALAGGAAVWIVEWRWPRDGRGRALPRGSLRARLNRPLPLRARDAAAAVAGTLLGAAPLLFYNLASAGTLLVLRANLTQTEKGADNLAIGANLAERVRAFAVLLEGSYFWWLGEVYANRLMPPLFLLAAGGLLALTAGVAEYRRWRNTAVFLLTLLAAIVAQSIFTVSGREATHLLLALPLPPLVIAAFAVALGRTLARAAGCRGLGRPARDLALALPLLVLLLPALAGNLLVDARYHRVLDRKGGEASFSDRIYELAAYLDRFDYTRPYALDWGMKYNVQLLTAGRVDPQEIYGQTADPPASFYEALAANLDNPYTVYLAHREEGLNAPATRDRSRVADFRRFVEARGKRVEVVKTIFERDGTTPIFYVYAIRER